jgi:hypothetical protein
LDALTEATRSLYVSLQEFDGFVKSPEMSSLAIPVKAGIGVTTLMTFYEVINLESIQNSEPKRRSYGGNRKRKIAFWESASCGRRR